MSTEVKCAVIVNVECHGIRELIDALKDCQQAFEAMRQAFLDVFAEQITDSDETADESQAEENINYSFFVSSCVCLVLLRLDLLPYYTSGFRSCRSGE